MLTLTINDKQINAPEGSTIMEAASMNSIHIPSLCNLEGIHSFGSCRICVVEVEGAKTLQASCITAAKEGMVVHTNTGRVRKARRVLYELLLSDHNVECLSCKRNQSCKLQELGKTLGIEDSRFNGGRTGHLVDASVAITRDMSKCVLCRRCITVCNEIQGVGILNAQNRGFQTVVSPSLNQPIGAVNCVFCGQCTIVCPVGALKETPSTDAVWDAIHDPTRRVVVQVAPAVRVAIGEEFGLPAGTRCTGKLASALKELRFDDVFDTNWAADLTILEEGTEFLSRVKAALTGGKATLPMITSCSPGWIKHIEHEYPGELDHLSTCKSPHTMMGAVVKSYYADTIGVDPKDLFVVSVMPCTAKKYEITRSEMTNDGLRNVDAVITTRELAEMIKEAGIDFNSLKESRFDNPLGLSTGAADIFGTTGGVMEAALRTVYELVTGRELPFANLHVTPIVGLEAIKEAAFTITDPLPQYDYLDGVQIKVAVTSGVKNANVLMDQVAANTSPYLFIEVMGCPGGCITGGGQPRSEDPDVRVKRMQGLYTEDESKTLRKSHENPAIVAIYENFLGHPNGHLSHKLLHTHYVRRGKYNEFTDETAVIAPPARQRQVSVAASERRAAASERVAAPTARPDMESERVLALTAQTVKLKDELADAKEIIDILRNIVADYSERS